MADEQWFGIPTALSEPDRIPSERLDRAYAIACEALLAERCWDGYWIGELSSSALATATAVSALSLVAQSEISDLKSEISDLKSEISDLKFENSDLKSQISDSKSQIRELIAGGLGWLAEHQNADGGWGDTALSFSNISTTMLVRAAFQLAGAAEQHASLLERATAYIDRAGGTAAVTARYGSDRTFAVPILANCALAGQADWCDVPPLPFELACLPHSWFRFLRLHVVSYALPALIAMGQLIHAKRPTRNLLARVIRNRAIGSTLRKLESIQPTSGGFLEAIPLTAFVIMSLAAAGQAEHPVARRGVEFLANSVRPDGSWPIDSNLSVWLTTLSVNAFAAGGTDAFSQWLPAGEAERLRDWILARQVRETHPYTRAAPGGWGWSHLPGSVPDADDTAGALLALASVPESEDTARAAYAGVRWLLDLQNRDGGWPTFCRGWGKLPFDRSGADLTAHALRAIEAWSLRWRHGLIGWAPGIRRLLAVDIPGAACGGLDYLAKNSCPDGSWLPLWFGSQYGSEDANPTYGTARVLAAYRDIRLQIEPARHGIAWLLRTKNADGGWGGDRGTSSTEETALAVEALSFDGAGPDVIAAIHRGSAWLVDRVESGEWKKPSPIGLYFAKLWYFEKLYPLIFTVAALGRARRVLRPQSAPTSAQL
jgi:squalene-hopene/tetraprenyl-beta-curcumene cyclase